MDNTLSMCVSGSMECAEKLQICKVWLRKLEPLCSSGNMTIVQSPLEQTRGKTLDHHADEQHDASHLEWDPNGTLHQISAPAAAASGATVLSHIGRWQQLH